MDSCKILQLENIKIGGNQYLWLIREKRNTVLAAVITEKCHETDIFPPQSTLTSTVRISGTALTGYPTFCSIPCCNACYNFNVKLNGICHNRGKSEQFQ